MTTPQRLMPTIPQDEVAKNEKAVWIAPAVQTMIAGEAEVSTSGSKADGPFEFS